MLIYQYTTIEALAQILKNQTIRFSRLDHVDDLEEGRIESQSIKLSKFIFVSCWTEAREESIPLWKLYSGDKGGVRIGLDRGMFHNCSIDNIIVGGKKAFGSGVSIEIPDKDYWILPIIQSDGSPFLRKIRYVDDVASELSNVINKSETVKAVSPDGVHIKDANMTLKTEILGAIKNKRWEFEKESRFTLFILPGNLQKYPTGPMVEKFYSNLINGNGVEFTHCDLHLNPSAFDSMEITMSPSSLPGQKIIVESLCSKYAPNAIIRDSDLIDLVKMKEL